MNKGDKFMLIHSAVKQRQKPGSYEPEKLEIDQIKIDAKIEQNSELDKKEIQMTLFVQRQICTPVFDLRKKDERSSSQRLTIDVFAWKMCRYRVFSDP